MSNDLKIKRFDDLTLEWLELIKTSRTQGGIPHAFDIVMGPVANDNTFRTVTLYLEGDLTAEQAVERLRYFHPNDQLSVHTQRALSFLTMIGCEQLGE